MTEASDRPRPAALQTEFEFPVRPRRRRRATTARVVVPPSRRLEISPEAFATSTGDVAGGRGQPDRSGIVEAAIVLLATVAFGLGWAVYELETFNGFGSLDRLEAVHGLEAAHGFERGAPARSGYAAATPSTPGARAGGTQWTADAFDPSPAQRASDAPVRPSSSR